MNAQLDLIYAALKLGFESDYVEECDTRHGHGLLVWRDEDRLLDAYTLIYLEEEEDWFWMHNGCNLSFTPVTQRIMQKVEPIAVEAKDYMEIKCISKGAYV